MKLQYLVVGFAVVAASCSGSKSATTTTTTEAAVAGTTQHTFETDHFADDAIVGEVTTVDCTLNNGTTTKCAEATFTGYPSSYKVGPFCPDTITTPADKAGIWFDGNGLYDLDGPFVANLATFYNDTGWKLYDSNGKVNVTDTQAAFEGAARPDVDPTYQNYCVEGRLEWLPDGKPITTTVQIPLQPVAASSPSSAHPGNFGVTLDGVVIAEAAPVDAILSAHTIASFDDCGGHYNARAGYHLHGAMGCGQLEEDPSVDDSAMFGYALDGYPIHLPLEGDALTTAKLDSCNGHSTAGLGYHYHANTAAKNAVLPCLTGAFVTTEGAGGPPAGGGQGNGQPGTEAGAAPDLSDTAAKLGVQVHELEDALAGGPNSDLDAAAKLLGVTRAQLEAALPPRPVR